MLLINKVFTVSVAGMIISACGHTPKPPSNPGLNCEVVADPIWESDAEEWSNRRDLKYHILRADNNGQLLDAKVTEKSWIARAVARPLKKNDAEAAINAMLCEAEHLAVNRKEREVERLALDRKKGKEKNTKDFDPIPTVKLLVHVHGGLNSMKTADKKVRKGVAAKIMNEDSENWHYPIFLSWPSQFPPTWAESTFRVREGRRVSLPLGLATSPFVISSDILRTAGTYPSTLYYQLANEKDRAASGAALPRALLSKSWKDAASQFCSKDTPGLCQGSTSPLNASQLGNLEVNYSTRATSAVRSTGRFAGLALTAGVRFTAGTIYHGSIATSSWDNMKRRASNLFYAPKEHVPAPADHFSTGEFFKILLDRAEARNNPGPHQMNYEITLVGHSMGAIVLNQALTTYRKEWGRNCALKNIVYMAAASSMDDTLSALSPILKPANEKCLAPEDARNFYNLTLNRVADISETHLYGLIPTGSLLVSIDQHYESPEHPMRRTFGSEINILTSLDEIHNAIGGGTGNLVLKAFDYKDKHLPSRHGDFSKIEFWKESTWKIDASGPQSGGTPFCGSIYPDEKPQCPPARKSQS